MAGDTITIQVVTPERTVIKDLPAEAVVVPVVDGSMGILPNHAPMVANLRIGQLKYKQNGAYQRLAISGGFLEFSNNKLTILADTAELSGDIDVMRAKQALERAQLRLRNRQANLDAARAEAAFERAINRLRAAGVEEEKRH